MDELGLNIVLKGKTARKIVHLERMIDAYLIKFEKVEDERRDATDEEAKDRPKMTLVRSELHQSLLHKKTNHFFGQEAGVGEEEFLSNPGKTFT